MDLVNLSLPAHHIMQIQTFGVRGYELSFPKDNPMNSRDHPLEGYILSEEKKSKKAHWATEDQMGATIGVKMTGDYYKQVG